MVNSYVNESTKSLFLYSEFFIESRYDEFEVIPRITSIWVVELLFKKLVYESDVIIVLLHANS